MIYLYSIIDDSDLLLYHQISMPIHMLHAQHFLLNMEYILLPLYRDRLHTFLSQLYLN